MFTQKHFDSIVGRVLNFTSGFHSGKQRFPKDVISIKDYNYQRYPKIYFENPSRFPKYINLICEFKYQERANKCLNTCVEMLVLYHLKKMSHINKLLPKLKPLRDLLEKENQRYIYEGMNSKLLFGLLEGKLFKEVRVSAKILSSKSFQTNYLAYILYHLGPVIISMKFQNLFSHAVLLKGVYQNTVLIHDPWFGADQHYHINTFNKYFDFADSEIIYFRDLNRLDEFYERDIMRNLVI